MTPADGRNRLPLRRCAAVALTAAAGFVTAWAALRGELPEWRTDPEPPLVRLLPPQGELVPFSRIAAGELAIPMPGVLVVRDAAAWRTLLARYPAQGRRPDSLSAVDFTRETLLLVGYGQASDCSDPGTYVQRVERVGGALRATIAWGHFPGRMPEVICAAVPDALVDVVRVPAAGLPIHVVGWMPDFRVPPAAPWLERPNVAETDTLAPFLRPLFLGFLAADSATPRGELVRLAAAMRDRPIGGVVAAMLDNPRVRADLPLLRELLAIERMERRPVQEVLLAHHGARLARDARTDTATLRLLVEAVRATADSSAVPRALARHPRLLRDSALAHDLYHGTDWPQIPCADRQRLWWAKKARPRDAPVCTPWDDSPVPGGVRWPDPPPPLELSDDTFDVTPVLGREERPRFRPRPLPDRP